MAKCVRCGLLGARRGDGTPMEATEWPRKNFEFPRGSQGLFVCFGGKNIDYTQNPDVCRKQFEQERHCKLFVKWQPGLTPKEHIEMNLALQSKHQTWLVIIANVILCIVGLIAALAAWWSATHPIIIQIPQQPSAITSDQH